MTPLPDYTVVLATYNRAAILRLCVEAIAAQTVRPREIIVIDGTEGMAGYTEALTEAADGLPLRHEAARTRSITSQRNQGIESASGQIVFLIDDDSLMDQTCAEEVLSVYAADAGERVVGVSPRLDPAPPEAFAERLSGIAQKPRGRAPELRPGLMARVKDFCRRRVVLMDREESFIPYDGGFHVGRVPAELSGLDVEPTALFHGCRMTFRRSLFEKERFEEKLRSYAAAEDSDFSYRASRHGTLLESRRAGLYHHTNASGRISRRAATHLTLLNLAFFLRANAADLGRARRAIRVYLLRRAIAEVIKDTFSKRFAFPQLRGVLDSVRPVRRIMNGPEDAFDEVYSRSQEAALASAQ